VRVRVVVVVLVGAGDWVAGAGLELVVGMVLVVAVDSKAEEGLELVAVEDSVWVVVLVLEWEPVGEVEMVMVQDLEEDLVVVVDWEVVLAVGLVLEAVRVLVEEEALVMERELVAVEALGEEEASAVVEVEEWVSVVGRAVGLEVAQEPVAGSVSELDLVEAWVVALEVGVERAVESVPVVALDLEEEEWVEVVGLEVEGAWAEDSVVAREGASALEVV
jgi:hypothetical protein